ncbi:hypothetical protein [Marmoricola sp. RAF53]|uniref:hypothetical protein n=1 Tax=Marmoricola sp. RAF53 TaxID=3233059 RepID=UPI003F95E6EE
MTRDRSHLELFNARQKQREQLTTKMAGHRSDLVRRDALDLRQSCAAFVAVFTEATLVGEATPSETQATQSLARALAVTESDPLAPESITRVEAAAKVALGMARR